MSNARIGRSYLRFYKKNKNLRVYPTEFVVRIFLAQYPGLKYKRPEAGDSILDIGFGDGRNSAFLCERGLKVSGIEISQQIVNLAKKRMKKLGFQPAFKVGRNSHIPFKDSSFDYILACHSCYYCDENEDLNDNLREYCRVLKPGGYLIASVADISSFIFLNGKRQSDGTVRIVTDPYNNRIGCRLQAFKNISFVKKFFSKFFTNFSFGRARNNYFDIDERVFWIVCEKN